MTHPLPQDPLLPHLPLALDGGHMRAVFAPWVGGTLQHCRIDRIKYRPRRNLSVSYRLSGQDEDGQPFDRLVATRWCHGGEAARRHAKALARSPQPTPAGAAVTHDPVLDLVAHWWPHDAKLGGAAVTLNDPATLGTRWLPEVAAAFGPGAAPQGQTQVELAQVVPEDRITARVRWTGRDGQTRLVYTKADAAGRGAQTQAVMQALWTSRARQRGELVLPQPLGWQAESGLQWMSALDGRTLLDCAPHPDTATAARVGTLLGALHATPVATERQHTLDELRLQPMAVADALAHADGRLAADAQRLARQLVRGVSELALMPMATLHGDLHPRNLLLADDGALGLIDLDSVRRGPLALDLGSWLADGAHRALLADADPGRTLASARAFIESHAVACGHRCSEAMLAWATAYQLLCQRAWRSLVNLKPGRYPRIAAVLALALRLLHLDHLDALAGAPQVQPT